MFLSRLRALAGDDRGDTIVQFVLVLPIFIILLFGSYQIWKVVHFKMSLEAATIQAARYLSLEGLRLGDEPPGFPVSWQQRAWNIVYEELANEPFLRDELDPSRLWVTIDAPYRRPDCPGSESRRPSEAVERAERAQFLVQSEVEIPYPLQIPFVVETDTLRLSETHWHYLECGPSGEPTRFP